MVKIRLVQNLVIRGFPADFSICSIPFTLDCRNYFDISRSLRFMFAPDRLRSIIKKKTSPPLQQLFNIWTIPYSKETSKILKQCNAKKICVSFQHLIYFLTFLRYFFKTSSINMYILLPLCTSVRKSIETVFLSIFFFLFFSWNVYLFFVFFGYSFFV